MKAHVGNLDFEASEKDIHFLFKHFELLETVGVATDWETGHSRGLAFVMMSDDSEAEKAIAHLDGAHLDGRSLRAPEAPPTVPTGFDSLAC